MKIIKIITLACIPATLFGLLLISSCAPEEVSSGYTLKNRTQGKTYILGSVTKGSTNVTSDFTGFKILVSPAGDKVFITTGGVNSATCAIDAEIDGIVNDTSGTITLKNTPNCFLTSILNKVSTNDSGSILEFNCTLPSSSIVITPGGRTSGTSDYQFNLVKQ
jgi:hypothetical protein